MKAKKVFLSSVLCIFWNAACSHTRLDQTAIRPDQTHPTPGITSHGAKLAGDSREIHLRHVTPLTRDGNNTQPRWSPDNEWLTFSRRALTCDQIYQIKKDGTQMQRLSSGQAQNASPAFFSNQKRILFSSTELYTSECSLISRSTLTIPLLRTYQLSAVKPDGSDPIPIEPGGPRAYTSEAAVCHDGSIVFTSDRQGGLELYRGRMEDFGILHEIRKVSASSGSDAYYGGASFSPDCTKITWHQWEKQSSAKNAQGGQDVQGTHGSKTSEQFNLQQHLEIWVADADGSHPHPVTRLSATSLFPVFTPDGKQILFSSNLQNAKKSDFDLYLIGLDGTGLERVTWSGFNSFPAFSPNGRYLAFSSDRATGSLTTEAPDSKEDINLFISEWQP